MLRSLDDLRILLGVPAYRGVVGERPGDARVSAHWVCGCNAVGASSRRLALRTCASHRAAPVEMPVAG